MTGIVPPLQSYSRSDSPIEEAFPPLIEEHLDEHAPALSAEDVLCELVPDCSPNVFGNLRRERIQTSVDLASLDRWDLRELGLTMPECSRLLAWAEEHKVPATGCLNVLDNDGEKEACDTPLAINVRLMRTVSQRPVSSCGGFTQYHMQAQIPPSSSPEEESRLDEIEMRAATWCRLVSSAEQSESSAPAANLVLPGPSRDLRETFLEQLFDLTPVRVSEVYRSVLSESSACPTFGVEELGQALTRFGLHMESETLSEAIEIMTAGRTAACLQQCEFEVILSRLKMAQLLVAPAGLDQAPPEADSMVVVDYGKQGATVTSMSGTRLRDFFFGHRPQDPGKASVRWIHLSGCNMTLLLALTVKYSLHPLGVEDVIEQSASKIERSDSHYYLATMEQLCTTNGLVTGMFRERGCQGPVQVHGRHMSMFCAGPPLLDTVLTISQPHRDFEYDWPGYSETVDSRPRVDTWVRRLQQRLQAPMSRLRERRADFLAYQILDLCSDELVSVSRAYMSRLCVLEDTLDTRHDSVGSSWQREVALIRSQLGVVARRLRGAQRMIRRAKEDPGLSAGLHSYFQDVADHLDSAHGDAVNQAERCSALLGAFEREQDRELVRSRRRADAEERVQQRQQELQSDRMNRLLFVLTVATTIFAPVQCFAAIMGMNFQTEDGRSSIPELMWKHGYLYSWLLILSYLVVSIGLAFLFYRRLHKSSEAIAHRINNALDTAAKLSVSIPNSVFTRALPYSRSTDELLGKCIDC